MVLNSPLSQKHKKVYDVYIIYALADKNIVYYEIIRRLEETKIKVFVEGRDLSPDDKWDEKLLEALASSRNCLIILSQNYIAQIKKDLSDPSEWRIAELNKALELTNSSSLEIIPIRIEDVEIPEQLRRFQYVDYFPKSADKFASWNIILKSLSIGRREPSKSEDQTNINIEENVNQGLVSETDQRTLGELNTQTLGELDKQTLDDLDKGVKNQDQPNPRLNQPIESNSEELNQQTPVSVDGSALSDLYSKEDLLGYSDYVNVLANFIESPKTKKPITMGIDAVWGSGKTTLMRLLEKRLSVREHTAVSKDESIRTIWFNAWQYDQQEALWAALVLEILTQVRKQFTWKQRIKLFFTLNYKRSKWGKLGWDIVKFILIMLAIIGAGYFGFSLLANYLGETWADVFEWLKDWVKVFATIGLASLAYTVFKDLSGLIVSPFSLGISQYMKEPDYKNKIGFVSQFQEDFKYVIESITQKGKWPLVIFIDDLDRCSAPKAAEVIEAINLLLDSEHCVFIIGMDRVMLSRSIQAKYKDIVSYFDDMDYPSRIGLGRHFLEKIIQIDFHIPQPDKSYVASFINAQLGRDLTQQVPPDPQQVAESLIQAEQRAGKTEDEAKKVVQNAHPDLSPVVDAAAESVQERTFDESPEVVRIVNELAPLLNYNPRRIKRFINMYRLQSLIAYQRNILGTVVSLDNLACWVAIKMRWPEFIDYAIKDTRKISQIRYDILELEVAHDKITAIEEIRESAKYPPDILQLLTDGDFAKLLNKIKGKAGEANSYFHLSQLSLTE